MRAFWAILAGLGGGIGGYIFTALVGFVVFSAGSPGDSGGVAMGVMFGLAPIGAVVGALLSVVLVLRSGKKLDQNLPKHGDSIELHAKDWVDLKNSDEPVKNAKNNLPRDAIIAFGAIGALIGGIYYWLYYEDTPSQFSSPKPQLRFEIELPKSAIIEDEFFKLRVELRSWFHTLPPNYPPVRVETGETTKIWGVISMHNKVGNRKMWLWPVQTHFYEFDLDLAPNPKPQSEFTNWRKVESITVQGSPVDLNKPEWANVRIRTQVIR